MNFNFATRPEIVGQGTGDASYLLKRVNKLLEAYPRGSGAYAQLQMMEEEAESYLSQSGLSPESQEFKDLHAAIGKIGSLLRAEQKIASERAIEKGQSTAQEEQQKKAQYEQQRAEKNLLSLEEFPGGAEAGGLKMGTVLTIAAAGLGAFLLFRG